MRRHLPGIAVAERLSLRPLSGLGGCHAGLSPSLSLCRHRQRGPIPRTRLQSGIRRPHHRRSARVWRPGDRWSPEALLIAAVADCFVLTFRAMAAPSQLVCARLRRIGDAERVDRASRFTHIDLSVRISVPDEMDEEKVLRVPKAEETCLITNSLNATVALSTDITRQ